MGYDKEYYEQTGVKIWENDKFQLHRLDGPAFEHADGGKFWYVNGQRHRLDGPAREGSDGNKEWYIHGKHLTEEEFNKHPLVLQYQLLKELDNGK